VVTAPDIPGHRVGGILGAGGFATVYRCWQLAVGREVAVKVDNRMLLTERDRRRFLREVTAAGRLSGHPHVIDVYDAARPQTAVELRDALADPRRYGAAAPAGYFGQVSAPPAAGYAGMSSAARRPEVSAPEVFAPELSAPAGPDGAEGRGPRLPARHLALASGLVVIIAAATVRVSGRGARHPGTDHHRPTARPPRRRCSASRWRTTSSSSTPPPAWPGS
jgi:Protein kinase domain